jgi:hypothetical protein
VPRESTRPFGWIERALDANLGVELIKLLL